jgi:hypothetical protein
MIVATEIAAKKEVVIAATEVIAAIVESAEIMEIEMIAAIEAEIEVSAKEMPVSSLQKVVTTRWTQESW